MIFVDNINKTTKIFILLDSVIKYIIIKIPNTYPPPIVAKLN